MQLDNDTIRARLKETFGAEPQESTAGRLNVVQGTVSKLLTGAQTLTLEMAYNVAKEYGVSVDWLLGLSEEKEIKKKEEETSYATATRVLEDLRFHGAIKDPDPKGKCLIAIEDPILAYLFRKSKKLFDADKEFHKDWITNKLKTFEDKAVLWSMAWTDADAGFLSSEASKDEHWVTVYERAKYALDEISESMSDPGPFGE